MSEKSISVASGHRVFAQRESSFFPLDVRPLMGSSGDFGDLLGPNIGAVMARTGWSGFGSPVVARVVGLSDEVLAVGWAMPIVWLDSKEIAINLSYATHPQARKQGLASLGVSAAVVELLRLEPSLSAAQVNIQLALSNTGSARVAALLEAQPNPERCFDVPDVGPYIAFSALASDLLERCKEVLCGAAPGAAGRFEILRPRMSS